MTLPTGTISFKQLAAEYNQPSTNISLGDYYYGGTILKSNSCTNVIRTNGTDFAGYTAHFKNISTSQNNISLDHYRGKSYYYAKSDDITISGNNAIVNTSTVEGESPKKNSENSAYFNVVTSANLTATATNQFACKIVAGNRANSAVYLVNNHTIYGKGGNGGRGNQNGSIGGNGGTALRLEGNSFVVNNGNIWGGGGGGGGGNSKRITYKEGYCFPNNTNYSISGSGGGGGAGGGSGGTHGDTQQCNYCGNGGNGGNGNYNATNAYGNGGSGCGSNRVLGTVCSNVGGRGGDWGDNGVDAGTKGGSGGSSIIVSTGKYYKLITPGSLKGKQTKV